MSALLVALGVGAAGAVGALARVLLDDAWLARRSRREAARTSPGPAPHGAGSRPLAPAGGLGARLRSLAGWPWPLLVVNVLGTFLLAFTAAALPHGSPWIPVLGAGLCGGLTTFSTWAVLIADAALQRRWARAVAVLAAHLVLGLGAAWLGHALGSL